MKTTIGFGIIIPLLLILGGLFLIFNFLTNKFDHYDSFGILMTSIVIITQLFLGLREIIFKCRNVTILDNSEIVQYSKNYGKITSVTEKIQPSKFGNGELLVIETELSTIKISKFYYSNYSKIKDYLKDELSLNIINEL